MPELTKEQAEYFKDSAISRDGVVIPMYCGCGLTDGQPNGIFREFKFEKQDSHKGLGYGPGFYFSSREDYIKEYASGSALKENKENTLVVYLNIKHPLYNGQNTITLDEYLAIAEKVDPEHKLLQYYLREKNNKKNTEKYAGSYAKYFPVSSKKAKQIARANKRDEIINRLRRLNKANDNQEFRNIVSNIVGMDKNTIGSYDSNSRLIFLFTEFKKALPELTTGEISKRFCEAVTKCTKEQYDGYVRSSEFSEAIAFFPNQIKAINNLEPTLSDDIFEKAPMVSLADLMQQPSIDATVVDYDRDAAIQSALNEKDFSYHSTPIKEQER